MIPFFGLAREHKAFSREYLSILKKSFLSGKVLQGKEIQSLEIKLANLHKRKYAVAVNSCTDALYFSLLSLNLKENDEVLVTNFSYVASASSIVRANLKPVFVDVNNSYNTDLKIAKKLITKRTKVLLYVHLFGQMGSPKEILEFCKENNLILIEDVAQAFGAERENKFAGSLGRISCVSFDPTKIIAAPGSGGAILCDRKDDYEKIKKLRYHGKSSNGKFQNIGFNSQMPSITAALILHKLNKNEEWRDKRLKIAKYYIDNLENFVNVPFAESLESHVYHKFVIQVKNQKKLIDHLESRNIQSMIHYKNTLSSNNYLKKYVKNRNYLKKSEGLTKRVVSLPIHPFLRSVEIEKITETVKKFIS
tara:strand:- start:1443 stop:2534 length:1092 start_codon:yes stop_codon:yes gene_type:complete